MKLLCLSFALFFLAAGFIFPTVLAQEWTEFYSDTYAEADAKFVAFCEQIENSVLDTFENSEVGPTGEALFARACSFGPESAEVAAVILTGVHGAEGYATGAAAMRVMKDTATGGFLAAPSDVRIVIFHAINPYGMAWGFKEDEDNVDILKNANQIYEVPTNKSDILVQFIENIDIPHFDETAVQDAAAGIFAQYAQTYGQEMALSFAYGQNEIQAGIAYYGVEEQWASRLQVETIERRIRSSTKAILVLDIHTAAGPEGDWMLAAYDAQSEDVMREWVEGANSTLEVEPLIQAGVSTDPWPFYTFVDELFPEARVLRMLWEAGTFPQEEYQGYLTLGIHCRFFQPSLTNDLCSFTRSKIMEYFYPNTPEWNDAIYNKVLDPLSVIHYGLTELKEQYDGSAASLMTLSIFVSCFTFILFLF